MSFNKSSPWMQDAALPPLPQYTLSVQPSIISWIPDMIVKIFLPGITYWVVSMGFHILDTNGWCAKYRVHTPAEFEKRNRATFWEVIWSILMQQALQISLGLLRFTFGPPQLEYIGKEQYDIAVWAQKIRLAQRSIPAILSLVGVDSSKLGSNLVNLFPTFASALMGGQYPHLQQMALQGGEKILVPAFAGWELLLAKTIYWYLTPLVQFGIAIFVLDTWQYMFHRFMHINQFFYTRYHSQHHRLYCPYAFGALYNHPVEGFLLDTLGAILASELGRLSTRQGTFFFTLTTIKTVDDHSGYVLPYDPLQSITPNTVEYHDIHHQTWGIKTNFSQPFLIFWDKVLGTQWDGGDTTDRYAKSRQAAERAVAEDKQKGIKDVANANSTGATVVE